MIWGTCGNASNRRMREILDQTLQSAAEMLEEGETVVEIGDI
jgi:predicted nuclease of predicted toxin-antitoxin system